MLLESSVQLAINLFDKDENILKREIPNFDVIVALRHIVDMLRWNHDAFIKDCEETFVSDGFRDQKSSLDADLDFSTRNRVRIMAQINLIYIIEGVLKRFYKDVIEEGNKFFPITFRVDEAGIQERKSEVELDIFYRHKLAAHTSYQSPQDDTLEIQYTSLMHLWSGSSATNLKEAKLFSIGDGVVHDGTSILWQKPNTLFKKYFFETQYQNLVSHLRAWETMFEKAMIHFGEQCPLKTSDYRIIPNNKIPGGDDPDFTFDKIDEIEWSSLPLTKDRTGSE